MSIEECSYKYWSVELSPNLQFASALETTGLELVDRGLLFLLSFGGGVDDMASILFITFSNIPRNPSIFHVLRTIRSQSLPINESIPEFDETNSALDESKRRDAWWVGLASRRDELGGHKSNHDETIWGVDETNSSATRGIGRIHDEMIWGVDETNSVHNETNQNNDSTTRNANLVSDLT